MTRTIELNLSDEDMIQITNILRETAGQKAWEHLQGAIGYLITWNTSYPKVTIYRDGKTDLIACYYNEQGERKYVIGAVWHETHYGFHS
jgi:hypothetical protein